MLEEKEGSNCLTSALVSLLTRQGSLQKNCFGIPLYPPSGFCDYTLLCYRSFLYVYFIYFYFISSIVISDSSKATV